MALITLLRSTCSDRGSGIEPDNLPPAVELCVVGPRGLQAWHVDDLALRVIVHCGAHDENAAEFAGVPLDGSGAACRPALVENSRDMLAESFPDVDCCARRTRWNGEVNQDACAACHGESA